MRCLPLTAASWALPTVAGLLACTVGPDYRQPQVSTPASYDAAPTATAGMPVAVDGDIRAWWTQFDDPKLSELVARGLAGSLSLETAVSRMREARLKEIESGAAAYPSLSATGSALKLHNNGGSGASGVIPPRLTSYAAGFDASWEIDLFGATRRAVEEASANTDANIWARRDGEVALAAEIANDYLSLRALQVRIATGEAELARQRDLFVLVAARRQAGFVTDLDVNQQSTLVATTAAQVPQLDAEAHARIHALGVLLGESPGALESELGATSGSLPQAPPLLPVGLPSELLLRRPDIRQAERHLAAASAGVGVKTAILYPRLNLYAVATFAGMSVSDLFSHQNILLAGLGMASEPILDAGKNRAVVGQAQEQRQQAELAYRLAVLGALRDVADALARHRAEESRSQLLGRAVEAAQGTVRIAQDQYLTGFVPFINVLQAQAALLAAQDQLTQSQAQVMTDLVAIYKALGGGWSS
jgi:NodT family efflux transporter outer membrane factor (OMF) lipoprotein